MKKFLMLIMMFCMLSLTSCSHIEDKNGPDDYTIATLTDEKIINGGSSIMNVFVETSTQTNSYLSGTLKCNKFSGIKQFEELTRVSGKFTIDCEVKSGNFMIVFIKGESIVRKVKANTNEVFNVYDNGYLVKIVGESANFSISYRVDY